MNDRYIIGECPRCHTLIIADGRYKSRTCPKCYGRIHLADMKVFKTAKDSRGARAILSEEKAVRGGLDQT